jgi:hypothetical protein
MGGMDADRRQGVLILLGLAVAIGLLLLLGTWIWSSMEMAAAGG